jgi:LysM repeat protein
MKNLRQVFLGIIIALASIGLILGGFSLSMAEGNISTKLAPTDTLAPTDSPSLQPVTPLMDSATPSPALTLTLALTWTPTWTLTLPPTPTNCPPPTGWLPYVVQSGDTLVKLAARFRITVARLEQANCLVTTDLLPGTVIYVPPSPLPTSTPVPPVPCGRPAGWVPYIVQPGDTLYRLSVAYGTTVAQLQLANCLGSSTILHVGQILYVPPVAPILPTSTIPFPPLPTDIPTMTPVPQPSDTPTEAPTSIPTEPPPPTATDTPVEVPTDTAVPTTGV